MWWCKGHVTARLLTLRFKASVGQAAPKRHVQPDFQGEVPAEGWKVPTTRDLSSYTPGLYLLQRGGVSAAAPSSDSDSDSGSSTSDGDDDQPQGASSSSSSAPEFWLAHTKPRKGSAARVLLQLRPVTGSDLRDSQQVCAPSSTPQQRSAWSHLCYPPDAQAAVLCCVCDPCRSARCKLASPSMPAPAWPSTPTRRRGGTAATPAMSWTRQALLSSW